MTFAVALLIKLHFFTFETDNRFVWAVVDINPSTLKINVYLSVMTEWHLLQGIKLAYVTRRHFQIHSTNHLPFTFLFCFKLTIYTAGQDYSILKKEKKDKQTIAPSNGLTVEQVSVRPLVDSSCGR